MRIYVNDEIMKSGKKPEHITSLSGDRMVSKTHGRIAFRGVIDTLEAEVIEAQVLASRPGEPEAFRACLGEILEYLRAIMAAEVKETPLQPPFLFGMDAETIHRQSHDTSGNFGATLPDHTQGPLAARLNTLRAKVREAELLAVRVFGPEGEPHAEDHVQRGDIILALNRLSSALWWLFCRYISRAR
jgi:ethanolamine utilization cobalamin adenosyltransferase